MAAPGKRIVQRTLPEGATLLDRLFAARGLTEPLDLSLKGLLDPNQLKGINRAAEILSGAVKRDRSILIVGDFDADGATSCALMVSLLTALGARRVNYLVPDRFKYGYGLTTEIVDVAAAMNPEIIVTVDNGIASIDGVAHANELGIEVIITDHHLPGDSLPAAAAIVNPNQPGCIFASKSLAGVGVAFYLLSVVRILLRESGWFEDREEPVLADWLDLVALGTIADVVPLDENNRRLVSEGLRRIRAGRCRPGLSALIDSSGLDRTFMTTRDLAFSIAPRLNAAGRLEDMSIGIECLLAAEVRAEELAHRLENLNETRKEIESGMRDEAMQSLQTLSIDDRKTGGICLYSKDWHQGIVGIVASRVKEKSHRPVVAFAKTGIDELKGSGRSVQGFHLRDALDTIATKYPGLLSKFGGHAMAAGLTLKESDYAEFSHVFDEEVIRVLGEADIEQVVVSDGEPGEPLSLDLAKKSKTPRPGGRLSLNRSLMVYSRCWSNAYLAENT
jgi:single-stranded-DNA-specific exonuclease